MGDNILPLKYGMFQDFTSPYTSATGRLVRKKKKIDDKAASWKISQS